MYANIRLAATMPAVMLTRLAMVSALFSAPRDYMRLDSPWIDSAAARRGVGSKSKSCSGRVANLLVPDTE
jgi:hypothetical protein